jgi:hypothetical protein
MFNVLRPLVAVLSRHCHTFIGEPSSVGSGKRRLVGKLYVATQALQSEKRKFSIVSVQDQGEMYTVELQQQYGCSLATHPNGRVNFT